MRHLGIAAFFLISLNAFSYPNPISEFQGGTYLGQGHFYMDNGVKNSYVSYAQVNPLDWDIIYVRPWGVSLFNMTFQFSETGLVNIELTENVPGQGPSVFSGEGYCYTFNCHFSVDMGDRILEETVSFAHDTENIYRFGSLEKSLPNGQTTKIVWEETMHRVDNLWEGMEPIVR